MLAGKFKKTTRPYGYGGFNSHNNQVEERLPEDRVRVHGREVRPKLYYDACGVCGRTILTGETHELYRAATEEEQAVIVCSVCRPTVRDMGLSKVA